MREDEVQVIAERRSQFGGIQARVVELHHDSVRRMMATLSTDRTFSKMTEPKIGKMTEVVQIVIEGQLCTRTIRRELRGTQCCTVLRHGSSDFRPVCPFPCLSFAIE
jgi:hypothetical protein